MDKQKADRIIVEYVHKIYGFAVKKSYSYEEAEELGAEMVKEVYLSILKAREIVNIEGYIWRICENTYAKYVASSKKKQGIALDGVELPYYDEYDLGDSGEELKKLRREIGFLTCRRRKIVYSFYYEGKSIQTIAAEQELPEGTVKWHLNKARNDLKEGFSMERKVGNLGISPVEAVVISHHGKTEADGGPEKYLKDRLNLNIVYSVYDTPRTKEEIAEELGMTPVFLEDRIILLTENGFLTELPGKRYTTYVKFSPRKISLEAGENVLKMKLLAARELTEQYVPKVREAIADFQEVYIPGGNRELFEAAVIFYAVTEKCCLPIDRDLSNYRIRTLGGGDYYCTVDVKHEIVDPDYQFTITESVKDYGCCGPMTRKSEKYDGLFAWSVDSRFCSREGNWRNNMTSDYEAVYEVMTGSITDTQANADKYNRLRERGFLTPDGKVNIMVVKDDFHDFFDRIPDPGKEIMDTFAGFALEQAMLAAKMYPSQMQDLVVADFVRYFMGNFVAMMVMDRLYDHKIFRPLTEVEKVTSHLLLFADRLPEG